MLEKKISKRITSKKALNHPYIVNSLLKDNYFDHKIEDKEKVAEKMKIRWVHLFFKQEGNNFLNMIKTFLSTQKIHSEIREKIANTFDKIDKNGNGMIEKQ